MLMNSSSSRCSRTRLGSTKRSWIKWRWRRIAGWAVTPIVAFLGWKSSIPESARPGCVRGRWRDGGCGRLHWRRGADHLRDIAAEFPQAAAHGSNHRFGLRRDRLPIGSAGQVLAPDPQEVVLHRAAPPIELVHIQPVGAATGDQLRPIHELREDYRAEPERHATAGDVTIARGRFRDRRQNIEAGRRCTGTTEQQQQRQTHDTTPMHALHNLPLCL